MRGVIKELYLYETDRNPYGFIVGDDGNKYYFNQQSMMRKETISSFYVNDEVSFTVEQTSSTYNRALHMKLERHIAEAPVAKFANPGISRKLDLDDFAPKLKPDSGEMESNGMKSSR